MPGLVRQTARFSVNRHNDCASNLQNRRTVSRILAASEEANLDGAGWSKISPGSAPRSATPPVTLSVPSSGTPLPLPLRTTPSPSPRTLARNPHPAPVESTFAPKPARTLPFPAHSEPKRIAHAGAGFPPRRPVPGAVTGFGIQAGDQPMGIKRGPWMAPRPLKILCDAAGLRVRIGATGGAFSN